MNRFYDEDGEVDVDALEEEQALDRAQERDELRAGRCGECHTELYADESIVYDGLRFCDEGCASAHAADQGP